MTDGIYNYTKSGKTTKYRKVGKDYFRLKSDGTLEKAKASGLTLANLKNSKSSSLVKESQNMTDGNRAAMIRKQKSDRITTTAAKKEKAGIDKAYSRSDIASRAKKEQAAIDKAYNRSSALSTIQKDTNLVGNNKASNKKVVVTKAQLEKSGLSLRDYMNMLESKRLGRPISRDSKNDKKTSSNQFLPKSRPKTENKVEEKVEKKTTTTPKKDEKKSTGFLDRVKEDLKKAVKETKRNFSDKRYFVNGVDSRKETIKSKSNITQKK
jgi:Cft2 family RNA processing exonuclease